MRFSALGVGVHSNVGVHLLAHTNVVVHVLDDVSDGHQCGHQGKVAHEVFGYQGYGPAGSF